MGTSGIVVPAGSRLVLHAAGGPVILRVLREITLHEDGFSIPVMASLAALQAGGGAADVPTAGGVVRCEAHLVLEDGRMLLRSGQGAGQSLMQQRREDVRGPVTLPLRGAVLRGLAGDEPGEAGFEGVTGTISAGGLSAEVQPTDLRVPCGSRLYVELELPEGPLVPAVLAVVEQSGDSLRAQFVDISPADRERLVRLVFAEERHRLATRLH